MLSVRALEKNAYLDIYKPIKRRGILAYYALVASNAKFTQQSSQGENVSFLDAKICKFSAALVKVSHLDAIVPKWGVAVR